MLIERLKKWAHSIYWKLGLANSKFPGTRQYWENLYKTGGNSGPGSYKRLAEYKAQFINSFIKKHEILQMTDIGCGDGNQVAQLEVPFYIGFDITETAVRTCKKKFENNPTKTFYLYDDSFKEKIIHAGQSDLAISLDVLFHLVEDNVFEKYMENLFTASKKYVLVYATNYNSRQTFHEKNRKFTDWVKKHKKDWEQIYFEPNPFPFDKKDPDNTSGSNFYIFRKFQPNTL